MDRHRGVIHVGLLSGITVRGLTIVLFHFTFLDHPNGVLLLHCFKHTRKVSIQDIFLVCFDKFVVLTLLISISGVSKRKYLLFSLIEVWYLKPIMLKASLIFTLEVNSIIFIYYVTAACSSFCTQNICRIINNSYIDIFTLFQVCSLVRCFTV